MSQTPLTDAYLASRCKGENKQSWVEFARGLELKLRKAQSENLKEAIREQHRIDQESAGLRMRQMIETRDTTK